MLSSYFLCFLLSISYAFLHVSAILNIKSASLITAIFSLIFGNDKILYNIYFHVYYALVTFILSDFKLIVYSHCICTMGQCTYH